jgi:tetratricopeptide (TPR) repeat protein
MAPLLRPPASAPELPSVRPPVPATQQQALVVADAMVRAPASAPVAVAPAPGPVPATAITRPRADTPAPEPASAPVPWPDAALEAVAQAQRLWNAGTREPALELLRDALAGIERNHAADLSRGGPGAAAALAMVRELVRMELVQAHHASVLAVHKRHERVWANQADLWAVRGSAAQRLSQHAESAQAYLVALRLRPGEPRWMLGAAVSLAAQGQPGPAADLVEQARAVSVVSPDVLAYLRQLGVPMRER